MQNAEREKDRARKSKGGGTHTGTNEQKYIKKNSFYFFFALVDWDFLEPAIYRVCLRTSVCLPVRSTISRIISTFLFFSTDARFV